MITENACQVRRHQTTTQAPSAQRTLPRQSHMPRPGRREEIAFAQTSQQLTLGARIRTWDMLEANGATRWTP